MAIAERLEKHGFPAPKELQARPTLTSDERYMARQFVVMHRTRGVSMAGPLPITLEGIHAFMRFWPQYDVLKFVEIVLTADQELLRLLADDRKPKDPPKGKGKKNG